jgi:hypothetical protein
MYIAYRYAKSIGLLFLVVALTMAISGVYTMAYALPGFGPDIPAYDFTLTASGTLIKIQPGLSGSLVLSVNPVCLSSRVLVAPQCDLTLINTVNLQVSGCPSGTFCILDRTQVLVSPFYSAASDFVVYSFLPSGVTIITVTASDQFGHSHVAQFGVLVCNC